jgi:hypothetical protein
MNLWQEEGTAPILADVSFFLPCLLSVAFYYVESEITLLPIICFLIAAC